MFKLLYSCLIPSVWVVPITCESEMPHPARAVLLFNWVVSVVEKNLVLEGEQLPSAGT